MGTEAQANLPIAARPIVTAGFRWAPLKVPTAYTATVTANAHPAVITIQPAFWPLVLLRTTLATTPSPRTMSSMVPSSSARNGDMERRSYQRWSGLSTVSGLCYPTQFGEGHMKAPAEPSTEAGPARKPTDEEIDVFGLTHAG